MPITFNGQTYRIPGVVYAVLVATTLAGPLPAFHIPVLLAQGFDGHPYDVNSKLVTGETDTTFTPFKRCNTDTAAAAYFGAETPLHKALRSGKRHGLPFAYVANLSPMTRAAIIADTNSTNIEQFTLYPRNFGPMGGWIKLKYASNVVTITPVKRYAILGVNAADTATRLYLAAAADWLTVGASVVIGGNTVAAVTRTVTAAGTETAANGQDSHWIEISSAVGSALNTSDYAVILQYADSNVVSPTLAATSQALIDWFNNSSRYFRAVKHTNFTDAVPATVASSTAIKEITAWGTRTAGTAPTPTSADVTAFASKMNAGEWEAFVKREQVIPQTYCLGASDSASHLALRDYATAERTRGFPISVTTGCAWGDTDLTASDDTNPNVRAAALNSQDVSLAAGGLDKEAAAISLAPAVWGRRVAGGPGHNLTNDALVFTSLENLWDEINSGELTSLLTKGVTTYKLSIGANGIQHVIAQGISTLQANGGLIWNTTDATTWSPMQRDLCDLWNRTMQTGLESDVIGADRADANAVAASLVRKGDALVKRGYVTRYSITGIVLNDSANGYSVQASPVFPTTVDFIDLTTTVLVGE